MPIITMEDKHYVKLGCHLRSVDDWDSDFWNNDKEFPNNGDQVSKDRLFTFEVCKKWINLNK